MFGLSPRASANCRTPPVCVDNRRGCAWSSDLFHNSPAQKMSNASASEKRIPIATLSDRPTRRLCVESPFAQTEAAPQIEWFRRGPVRPAESTGIPLSWPPVNDALSHEDSRTVEKSVDARIWLSRGTVVAPAWAGQTHFGPARHIFVRQSTGTWFGVRLRLVRQRIPVAIHAHFRTLAIHACNAASSTAPFASVG